MTLVLLLFLFAQKFVSFRSSCDLDIQFWDQLELRALFFVKTSAVVLSLFGHVTAIYACEHIGFIIQ